MFNGPIFYAAGRVATVFHWGDARSSGYWSRPRRDEAAGDQREEAVPLDAAWTIK